LLSNFGFKSNLRRYTSAAEHAQVLYRGADVTAVWPRAAAAQSGAMLTLRGWGFASGQHAGPGWACQILLCLSN